MRYRYWSLLPATLLALAGVVRGADWMPGRDYEVLARQQRTSVPAGKVEVMEVFSYGCPACRDFRSVMNRLKAALPDNAQVTYLPASWHEEEAWPVFQRAYLTAQALGVADKAHDAMYEAVWTTGELGVTDPGNPRRLRQTLPSMDDVARFYQRVTGVKAADFISTANSSALDEKVRQTDARISAMEIPGTPTLVVNGAYRVVNQNHTGDEIIELVKYLVARESKAPPKPN